MGSSCSRHDEESFREKIKRSSYREIFLKSPGSLCDLLLNDRYEDFIRFLGYYESYPNPLDQNEIGNVLHNYLNRYKKIRTYLFRDTESRKIKNLMNRALRMLSEVFKDTHIINTLNSSGRYPIYYAIVNGDYLRNYRSYLKRFLNGIHDLDSRDVDGTSLIDVIVDYSKKNINIRDIVIFEDLLNRVFSDRIELIHNIAKPLLTEDIEPLITKMYNISKNYNYDSNVWNIIIRYCVPDTRMHYITVLPPPERVDFDTVMDVVDDEHIADIMFLIKSPADLTYALKRYNYPLLFHFVRDKVFSRCGPNLRDFMNKRLLNITDSFGNNLFMFCTMYNRSFADSILNMYFKKEYIFKKNNYREDFVKLSPEYARSIVKDVDYDTALAFACTTKDIDILNLTKVKLKCNSVEYDDTDACSICFEEACTVKLPCGHDIGFNCYYDLNECPFCRQKIQDVSISTDYI